MLRELEGEMKLFIHEGTQARAKRIWEDWFWTLWESFLNAEKKTDENRNYNKSTLDVHNLIIITQILHKQELIQSGKQIRINTN